MKQLRQFHGALSFESLEARPIFDGDAIRGLEAEKPNRAKDLIADFMIAANGVTARYLASRKLPSLRRVVRTPKRWDADCRDCPAAWIQAPRRAGSETVGGVSGEGAGGRSAAGSPTSRWRSSS